MTVNSTHNVGEAFDVHKNNRESRKNIFIAVAVVIAAAGAAYTALKYILGFDVINVLKDLFMLKYLPKLNADAGLGILFIFGVLTSFHCIGMCGGIAISQTARVPTDKDEDKARAWFVPSTLYNIGRIMSYTVVGGIVGGLGSVVRFNGIFKGAVPIIGGVFMVIMGINLLGFFPFLRRFNIRLPVFFAKKIKSGKNYGTFYVGLMNGLMPCGPLQMVQLYALGTRSIIYGAFSMFVFSVGTVPALFIFGAVNTIINKKFSNVILKVSAVLVITLGVVMVGRGLALSGIALPIPHSMNMESKEGASSVKGNLQTITTEIKSDSYPAIKVQKGIPVKWIIKAKKENLNDCNNAIVIPRFKIEKRLVEGDNVVEFTPLETGDIIFTCWMGMIKSKITVVDSVENKTSAGEPKQPQIK